MKKTTLINDYDDAINAFEVFRSASRILFLLLFVALLAVQGSFWIVDSGMIDQAIKPKKAIFRVIPLTCDSQSSQWENVRLTAASEVVAEAAAVAETAGEVVTDSETMVSSESDGSADSLAEPNLATDSRVTEQEPGDIIAAEQQAQTEQASSDLAEEATEATGQAVSTDEVIATEDREITINPDQLRQEVFRQLENSQITQDGSASQADAAEKTEGAPFEGVQRACFYKNLSRIGLQVGNVVIIFAAVVYFFTIVFLLLVAIAGRLGGLQQLSKAVLLGLIFLVIILPWQRGFAPDQITAMTSYPEITNSYLNKTIQQYDITTYYARFVGLWAVALLLLTATQARAASGGRKIIEQYNIRQEKALRKSQASAPPPQHKAAPATDQAAAPAQPSAGEPPQDDNDQDKRVKNPYLK